MNIQSVDRNGIPILKARNSRSLTDLHTTNHGVMLIPGKPGECQICARRRPLTKHHLRPKALGGGKGANIALLCVPCHTMAHMLFELHELAELATIDLLRSALRSSGCLPPTYN